MYAARRRRKSVRGKFQFGKLGIGQQFQLLDNTFRQLPQGGLIGHQVALHEPQFMDKRLMQCYLMPDETALRELSEGVIEKLKLLTDAEFAELEFPPD